MGCTKRRIRRTVYMTVAPVLLLYLALAGFAWLQGDRLLFHPKPSRYADAPEILKIPVAGGGTISARYLHNPDARFTILCSHGTSNDLGTDGPALQRLRDHGFSVLGYDYRGYGTSGGEPSETNACQDIEAAYHYLVDTLHTPPRRIVAMGQSLGGGPATWLASRYPVAGLILESTFVSVFRVATRLPVLPFDKFPNLARLRQVRCPVLVMHGTGDEMVAFWHGQALFEAARPPKLHLWVEGAGHEDLVRLAGEAYWQAIESFIRILGVA